MNVSENNHDNYIVNRIDSSNDNTIVNVSKEQQQQQRPNEYDVLCIKDKTWTKHLGNRIFRDMILSYANQYENANKNQKMMITKKILYSMKTQYNSRFLKQNSTNSWENITEKQERDKVSHAFRFILKTGIHNKNGKKNTGKNTSKTTQLSSASSTTTTEGVPTTAGCVSLSSSLSDEEEDIYDEKEARNKNENNNKKMNSSNSNNNKNNNDQQRQELKLLPPPMRIQQRTSSTSSEASSLSSSSWSNSRKTIPKNQQRYEENEISINFDSCNNNDNVFVAGNDNNIIQARYERDDEFSLDLNDLLPDEKEILGISQRDLSMGTIILIDDDDNNINNKDDNNVEDKENHHHDHHHGRGFTYSYSSLNESFLDKDISCDWE